MVPENHLIETDVEIVRATQARIKRHRAAIADLRAKGHSSEMLDGVLRYLVAAQSEDTSPRRRAPRVIDIAVPPTDPEFHA
ncbi:MULTISPECIES: hypothetical protein [unclassified Chelatococcus]|uniref:hypothetical protein n=1 Tax=unclassified Chelatococcus TaxID=2638111 RepID=UPI001BD077E7|nr:MULTISPECIES: hypothetical protein [unclassified Chelatococcus]MBS7696298.1 hypothetical protein [Chelatococcus sp. YT9]MBX3556907.1 hypothetical protein [Chelatococcus sp.]